VTKYGVVIPTSLATGPIPSFKHVLDLVAHKYPNMDVLKLVTDEADLDDSTLDILEAHSSLKRYRSLTYVSSSDDLLDAARKRFPGSRETSYESADLFASPEEPKLEDSGYDLFIFPEVRRSSLAGRCALSTDIRLGVLLAPEQRVSR
jgi:hypothetical protein